MGDSFSKITLMVFVVRLVHHFCIRASYIYVTLYCARLCQSWEVPAPTCYDTVSQNFFDLLEPNFYHLDTCSHLSPAEIQEIVSSQSQKARESTPTHIRPAKLNSAEKASPGVTNSSSYATAVLNNHRWSNIMLL